MKCQRNQQKATIACLIVLSVSQSAAVINEKSQVLRSCSLDFPRYQYDLLTFATLSLPPPCANTLQHQLAPLCVATPTNCLTFLRPPLSVCLCSSSAVLFHYNYLLFCSLTHSFIIIYILNVTFYCFQLLFYSFAATAWTDRQMSTFYFTHHTRCYYPVKCQRVAAAMWVQTGINQTMIKQTLQCCILVDAHNRLYIHIYIYASKI